MRIKKSILLSTVILLLCSCTAVPDVKTSYDPAKLRFDGERAYAIESQFVSQFPNRSSGQPNSLLATEWLKEQLTGSGWDCQIDEWEVINYSKPVVMQNVVCKLPGKSSKEILVAAHHDQSPATIEGADNDGSGIAILLHLAEIFGAEGPQPYTLVFVSTDGEEYGMLGTRRYIQTYPNPSNILAGISLDNLGKTFYNGMDIEAVGQYHNFGALWLQLLAGESARAAGDLWIPKVRSPLDQVLGQAVPISFMDQGPLVAAGIPALGFAGKVPAESAELHWQTYHSPEDVMSYQSADVLYQSGRITEALIRQLLSMESFPKESGPYLYLDASRQVVKGVPLWAGFIGFVALFFIASLLSDKPVVKSIPAGWLKALPHFLSLWLPLAASVLLMYFMVAVGIMDRYEVYPATTKDPATLNPRWLAVIIFLVGLAVFIRIARWLLQHFNRSSNPPEPAAVKSLGLFMVGLAGVYVLAVNPFSLLFFIPLLFWFMIKGRKGWGSSLDILFFLLGGLMVYALFYFFGFVIQRMGFAVLWYMMMMFSIGEVGPLTALAITAILAAGLSMVIRPAVKIPTTVKSKIKSVPETF